MTTSLTSAPRQPQKEDNAAGAFQVKPESVLTFGVDDRKPSDSFFFHATIGVAPFFSEASPLRSGSVPQTQKTEPFLFYFFTKIACFLLNAVSNPPGLARLTAKATTAVARSSLAQQHIRNCRQVVCIGERWAAISFFFTSAGWR